MHEADSCLACNFAIAPGAAFECPQCQGAQHRACAEARGACVWCGRPLAPPAPTPPPAAPAPPPKPAAPPQTWYSRGVQALQKGEVLARRYRILELIGQGAMSSVYLVEDLRLPGARWALKELIEATLPEHEREMARILFQREGEILAGLSHPGLPRIIGAFTEGDRHYLAMERIAGAPLDDMLAGRSQPLRPHEALPIALQATHVLEYLHSRDPAVIFRDLKPSNLMISPLGRVRFIDFGIARFYRIQATKDTQELGTPGFCAPEQYHGQSTPRSDLYSLGVTLFFLLTLKDPQSFQFKFPRASQFQPVPPILDEALGRCLELRPQDRYSSAASLRYDLELSLRQLPMAPAGVTQTLSGPLMELGRHVQRVPGPEGPAIWHFWKEWFVRTFNLDSGSAPRNP